MRLTDTEKLKINSIFTDILLVLAVVFSVFSQIEVYARLTRPFMYIFWILLVLFGCIKKKGKLFIDSFAEKFIFVYFLFFVFCFITGLVDTNHYSTNYIRVLIVPLIVSVVGCMYSDIDKKTINVLGKVYVLAAFVFGLWVQVNYFPSYNFWLKSRIYLFLQKNSAGQIWVSAIFVSLFLLEHKKKIDRIIFYAISIYLLIMTGLCQCRTALLGLAVALISFAILRARHKFRLILFLAAFALAIWTIPYTHKFIEQALLLNKYAGADINTFASGRIDKYLLALSEISKSPIIGIGNYYVDCSYILIAAESGYIPDSLEKLVCEVYPEDVAKDLIKNIVKVALCSDIQTRIDDNIGARTDIEDRIFDTTELL